jgi:Dehydrogenases with different specificities (related to short-chain alcohol dehydrogenases)
VKRLLIIGSDSNLAKYIIEDVKKSHLSIFKITRKEIDFDTTKSKFVLNKYLKKINPDIIVNCVGVFKNNDFSFKSIFNINTKVSWDLIDYYRSELKKKVKIIFIGSSAYNKPRKNYILYVASKSALNSIVKSAKDLFLNTNIKLSIINPPAMKSKMRNKFYKNNKLKKHKSTIEIDPRIIARKILRKF